MSAVCQIFSYLCAVFRSNPWDIHIDESVFALSLTGNVAIFYESRANEQHSFLFRLCGKGVLYPAIPHIYSSVGYCIVYLIRVSHNLLLDIRNNLTLSFCINPSFGVGGTSTNQMVREAKTTKEISLQTAVTKALRNCPVLLSTVISTEAIGTTGISGCYDAKGNEIEPDCIENCKSGNFSATVRINIPNGESHIKDISGAFTVIEYDAENCSFKVEIEHINQ